MLAADSSRSFISVNPAIIGKMNNAESPAKLAAVAVVAAGVAVAAGVEAAEVVEAVLGVVFNRNYSPSS
jgi:hypothetical protein